MKNRLSLSYAVVVVLAACSEDQAPRPPDSRTIAYRQQTAQSWTSLASDAKSTLATTDEADASLETLYQHLLDLSRSQSSGEFDPVEAAHQSRRLAWNHYVAALRSAAVAAEQLGHLSVISLSWNETLRHAQRRLAELDAAARQDALANQQLRTAVADLYEAYCVAYLERSVRELENLRNDPAARRIQPQIRDLERRDLENHARFTRLAARWRRLSALPMMDQFSHRDLVETYRPLLPDADHVLARSGVRKSQRRISGFDEVRAQSEISSI